MIYFIDSNIPMYVIGANHPNKQTAIVLLEKLIAEKHRLVTNTEVFQEILHRYAAISRREAIQPAFDCLNSLVDETYPVLTEDVNLAKDLLLAYESISARDALHVAHIMRHKADYIVSFDKGFDQIPGVKRMSEA